MGTGTRDAGAHVLAEQLQARYGSLPDLARAHPSELATIRGMGPAKSATVAAVFELGRRLPRRKLTPRPELASTADLYAIVTPLLTGRTLERLVLLVCDQRNRVVHIEVVAEGLADRAIVPVREILTAVPRHDGTGFAIAHNHPSGDPAPSVDDLGATKLLRYVAQQIGLDFLDHIVVTDETWRRVIAID